LNVSLVNSAGQAPQPIPIESPQLGFSIYASA
jgi:hypothetical protein